MDEQYNNYKYQESLQQQEIDANNARIAPQLQEQMQQSQAVLIQETNPKHVVKTIMLRLRGVEERFDGKRVRVAEPKMNQKGIDNIWFILDSHINQNIIFSHLDLKQINNIMDSLQNDLVDDLALNWKIYGIQSKTDLDHINNSVLTNVFLALKRSEGQNEKNWLGKISMENISAVNRNNIPKEGGFWSKLKL